MKRIVSIFFVFLILLSCLNGCNREEDQSKSVPEVAPEPLIESVDESNSNDSLEDFATDTPDKNVDHIDPADLVDDVLCGITYKVSKTWDRQDGPTDLELYYYPEYDYIAIAYFSIQEAEVITSLADDVSRTSLIEGVAGTFEDYNEVSTETIDIAENPGIHHIFSGFISGHMLDCELYSFVQDGYIISLLAGIQNEADDSTKEDFSSLLLILIESIDTSGFIADSTIETTPESTLTPETDPTPEPTEKPTTGESNALRKGKEYIRIMPFSYSGLIEQLEFDGYSHDEAVYAADNCNADWYEQAAKKAAKYLDIMTFSHDGLIDQLTFDGFTYDQAVYGAEQNGY